MKTVEAVEFFGDERRLARILGITATAIRAWGDEVPDLRQYQLQVISKGKLRAREGLQAKHGWVEHES